MIAHYSDANVFNLLASIKRIGGKHNRAAYGYEITEDMFETGIRKGKLAQAMKSARKYGLVERTERNLLYQDRFKLTGRGEVILSNVLGLYTLYDSMKGEV